MIQIHSFESGKSFETDPENTIIRSGLQWFATAGNPLDAHGGGFFVDHKDEKYYWFGMGFLKKIFQTNFEINHKIN